jgi:hypothetical protein
LWRPENVECGPMGVLARRHAALFTAMRIGQISPCHTQITRLRRNLGDQADGYIGDD